MSEVQVVPQTITRDFRSVVIPTLVAIAALYTFTTVVNDVFTNQGYSSRTFFLGPISIFLAHFFPNTAFPALLLLLPRSLFSGFQDYILTVVSIPAVPLSYGLGWLIRRSIPPGQSSFLLVPLLAVLWIIGYALERAVIGYLLS